MYKGLTDSIPYFHTQTEFAKMYPYLLKYEMTREVCDQLLQKEDITWVLTTTPCNGFYANLLSYQRSSHPILTNREVGTLLSKIDPCLAATIDTSRPENVFKKVNRICLRKRDMDALVTYTPSKN